MSQNGILLFAKQPGPTSFSAIGSVKRALKTTKVGHTGTLDSFAQGLLVVCIGSLTKLAGNITAFNKSYKAVIKFGEETDTLEYTGKIIKTAPLPIKQSLEAAVQKFTGDIMQTPPLFSAIHVDGKRASDLAREGKSQELPARPVTVFKAEIEELKLNSDGLVEYALINFSVSKGTYIRSLARDIGAECASAAHLTGLFRTQVGSFNIEDSADFSSLKEFTIENAVNTAKEFLEKPYEGKKDTEELYEDIKNHLLDFDKDAAALCGFETMNTTSPEAEANFKNGKRLLSPMFTKNLHSFAPDTQIAVFNQNNNFIGLIYKNPEGRVSYKFVINQ